MRVAPRGVLLRFRDPEGDFRAVRGGDEGAFFFGGG